MKKNHYILILALAIIIFAIIRAQFLYLGYHWDEMWSYVPAVRTMHATGVSMLPSSMDPIVSRGHPLFFYATSAAFLKIFGTSTTSMHAFPLIVSLFGVLGTYFLGKKLFSPMIALIASILLMIQAMFFVQAGMMLPEVMVMTLAIWSFYAFFSEKWLLYFIFSSLLVLTKESGITLPAAIGLCFFIGNVDLKNLNFWKKTFWIGSPLLVFALFLWIQKMTFGWFLFPEHVGMMHLETASIVAHLKDCFNIVFIHQNRKYIFIVGALFLVGLLILKKIKGISYEKFPTSVIYLLVFIMVYFLFSSVNFFTVRYMTATLPMAILMVVGLVNYLIEEKYHWAMLLFFTIGGTMTLKYTIANKTPGDVEIGNFDLTAIMQESIDYLQTQAPNNQEVIVNYGFLKTIALRVPYAGYVQEANRPVLHEFKSGAIGYELCLERDAKYEQLKAEGKIEVLKRFEKNQSYAEVFRVR